MQRICDTLLKMSLEGRKTFTRTEWGKETGVLEHTAKDDCRVMKLRGLVICSSDIPGAMRYYHLPIDETGDNKANAKKDNGVRTAIEAMLKSPYVKERRTAEGLLDMLDNGIKEFTFADWVERNPVSSKNVGFVMLRIAMNHGFLTFDNIVYRFVGKMKEGPQYRQMPDKQRDILLQLMSAFPEEKFTKKNAAQLMGFKEGTMDYYLNNLEQRGLLKLERAPKNINLYSFSNDVHAIFEAVENQDGQTKFEQLPAMEKQIHNPVQDENEAC